MKLGVMGGTFDPVHNGHMAMIRAAADELQLDRVMIIPAGNPYFKNQITPYEIRFEMLREAIAGEQDARLCLSDMERDQSRPTYTYETLQILKDADPETQIWFICGADVLEQIHSWRYPERILRTAGLAVFSRRDAEGGSDSGLRERMLSLQSALYDAFPEASCRLLQESIPDISSTMIREAVRRGEDISHLVPAAVGRLIAQYRLYTKEQ